MFRFIPASTQLQYYQYLILAPLQELAIAALLSALAFASDMLPLRSLLESELEMSFGPYSSC